MKLPIASPRPCRLHLEDAWSKQGKERLRLRLGFYCGDLPSFFLLDSHCMCVCECVCVPQFCGIDIRRKPRKNICRRLLVATSSYCGPHFGFGSISVCLSIQINITHTPRPTRLGIVKCATVNLLLTDNFLNIHSSEIRIFIVFSLTNWTLSVCAHLINIAYNLQPLNW